MKKPNLYIRFLRLVDVLNSKMHIRRLDAIENSLLNNIMTSDDAGESVFVGDLLRLNLLGSHATLHGRLKHLRHLGYVKLIAQDDARRKRVMPTPQAHSYFKLMSDCLSGAVTNT